MECEEIRAYLSAKTKRSSTAQLLFKLNLTMFFDEYNSLLNEILGDGSTVASKLDGVAINMLKIGKGVLSILIY